MNNQFHFSLNKLYKKNPKLLTDIENGYMSHIEVEEDQYLIGYQGIPGAFSEEALINYFDNWKYKAINFKTFEDVVKNLQKGNIDFGILPIENSSAGSIVDVYDIIRKYNCYIVGEKVLSVKHNLLVQPGAKLEDIKKVYSHPQGFSQSSSFLSKHDKWQQIPYYNTAISARYVKESKDKTKAAIASLRAAKLYNLEPIKKSINYSSHNHTRFIIVSRDINYNDESDKVSLIFSVAHESGSLYHALAHFYYNGINLLKIESRPIHDRFWEYFFFVDLEGNLQDANLLIALGRILDQSSYFHLLGNYKSDK